MASREWTTEEFNYLIECLAECKNAKTAYDKCSELYGQRSRDGYRKKLQREGISSTKDLQKQIEKHGAEKVIKTQKLKEQEDIINKVRERELKSLKYKQNIIDIFVEQIKSEVYRLPKPSSVSPIKPTTRGAKEQIVAPISDVQIGEFVDARDIGGLGEYSFKIFEDRTEIWKNFLIKTINSRLQDNTITQIHIPFIGDIVEGMNIFKSQAHHIEFGLIKQAMKGALVFAQALAEISATFPTIPIKSVHVGGNHGRIGDKGETPYTDNWDRLIGFIIQLMLEDYKNIEIIIPDHWFWLENIYGWNMHFSHGDDIKSWMSIPTYGLVRAQARETMMINQAIHYYVCGHHHVLSQLQNGYGEVICNGNWVGANEFVAKQIKSASRPCQIVMSVTEKYGVGDRFICYFETKNKFLQRQEDFIKYASMKVGRVK